MMKLFCQEKNGFLIVREVSFEDGMEIMLTS